MAGTGHTLTRRGLLRSAGAGAAGLALTGALGELLTGAGSRAPGAATAASTGGGVPPQPPNWRSRPDLRIPALTITRNEPGASDAPIFIAPYNSPTGQAGAVIVAADGEPIWENPLARKVTTNFHVQSYRGSPVLTWWEGEIELGHGVGEYVIADTSYRTVRRVQAADHLRGDLHEFVITPRDTALLTSYVVRKHDLSAVGGPRAGTIQDAIFQEVDLASGRLLLEWHSLDHIPLDESYSPVEANWDFFHINSVDLDTDGTLLVSARSTHTVYKIARDGSIVWRLGGKRSDFAMGAGTTFAWQHDARRQPDGTVTLFDNGATPAVEPLSRGLILDVDEQAMSASLLRQYSHQGVLSGSQGNVQLLENGNVFVGWGEAPRVSEFDRSGRLLFDAVLGEKYECYRAFRMPWSARPAQAPALAVSADASARTAYASWNGATGVHAWELLAGGTPHGLSPVARVPAAGFETALPLPPRAGPRVAAQALDAHGKALGRSPAVTVT
ncbi:MAG TPA: arylsulfotransferase family protein [Solirubrobacteraceae bacterium]|nr:arylsulfotransferase family protein [Solirubrobacteraceae bacterium]